jgi:hypothetical protein
MTTISESDWLSGAGSALGLIGFFDPLQHRKVQRKTIGGITVPLEARRE